MRSLTHTLVGMPLSNQPRADLALLFLENDCGGWDARNEVVEAYGQVDTAWNPDDRRYRADQRGGTRSRSQ